MTADSPHWARRGALGVLLASMLLLTLLTACGITLGSGEEETEIFKRLTITGDRRLGENLNMRVEYEQPYNVEIDVTCELLEAHPRSTARPVTTPTPQGDPPATPTIPPIPRAEPTSEGWQRNLLGERIPPNENGGLADEVTPTTGELSIDFFAPELPGDYEIRCYTPESPENEITAEFTIQPVLSLE
jgi:hypothetical protein